MAMAEKEAAAQMRLDLEVRKSSDVSGALTQAEAALAEATARCAAREAEVADLAAAKATMQAALVAAEGQLAAEKEAHTLTSGRLEQARGALDDAERRARMRAAAETARVDSFRVGMDHFAFGVPDRETLEFYERRLEEMGATYTPVADSPVGPVVVFRDPDGIQGEFFLPG